MKSIHNKLNTKDFILIGVLTAVFFVVYLGISMVTALAGPVVHLFASAITGLVAGVIMLLLASKVPKKGVFTINTFILMMLMQFAGGGYLPWLISSMASAIIADLICLRSQYKSINAIATAFGVMMFGQMLGNVLPILLFVDQFRADFASRGIDSSFLDLMIRTVQGPMSLFVLGTSFLGGFIGIYIGRSLMNKHFRKAGLV